MTRILWQLALVLVVQCLTPFAAAAETSDLSVVPEFGFDGIMATERWAPVRFVLTSASDPVSGTLTLRYLQDGSQQAMTTTRFSLAPGISTPVDVGVCLARFANGIGVTIRTDAGRTLVRDYLDFNNPARAKDLPFVPPSLVSRPTTILSVGLDGLAEAGHDWSRVLLLPMNDQIFSGEDDSRDQTIEHRQRISAVEPADLFSFWSAYDGVSAVVIRASVWTQLPQRAERALLAWQRGGGELVVVVDDASMVWRRWLPDGPEGDFIEIEEPRQVQSPREFWSFREHAKASGIGEESLAKGATNINARLIARTRTGAMRGWELIYDLDRDPHKALAARGPAGLGFITFVGFDPGRATEVRSRKAGSIAWGAVLERILEDSDNADVTSQISYYSLSSGSSPEESQAINTLIDATLEGEGLSIQVLLVVLAVLAAFVLGIGPVDALVLRRLGLRHWSWLTALGWVALASVLAVQIPNMTMGGKTHIGRAVVTDTLLTGDGKIVGSWSTGVTTIYAGHSGTVGPQDRRAGSWWRGVSPLEIWQWGGSKPAGALSTMRLNQRTELAQGGARITVSPAKLTQRGWTARAMLDMTPQPPPVSARVLTDKSSRWLELTPGPRPVTIDSVKVTIGAYAWHFDKVNPEDEIIMLNPADGHLDEKTRGDREINSFQTQVMATDSAFGKLPRARARWQAMTQWAEGTSSALIEIRYHTNALAFDTIGNDSAKEQGLVRIARPIILQQPEQKP